MTADDCKPQILAISTEASVWPALTKIPPSRATSGNICPGLSKSWGLDFGFATNLAVVDLSWADIPVVVPLLASMEIVNAVVSRFSFGLFLTGDKSSLSATSVSIVTHINPLPWVAIKLITFGVANSDATIRSPSFSLSASSTRITILPFLKSLIASSIFEIGIISPKFKQFIDIKYIRF